MINKDQIEKELEEIQPWHNIPREFKFKSEAFKWDGKNLKATNFPEYFGSSRRWKSFSEKLNFYREDV